MAADHQPTDKWAGKHFEAKTQRDLTYLIINGGVQQPAADRTEIPLTQIFWRNQQ